MYSPEQYQLKKSLLKNKKLQKQIAEYNEKRNLKAEKDEIKNQSKKTKQIIAEIFEHRQKLFQHTNKCENELISYIALLNAKMYRDQSLSSQEINEKYKENLSIIKQFQDIKRWELHLSKNELEAEIMDSFSMLEKQQNDRIDKKIEEQKKIFEQMEITKKELEEIKGDFASINKMCEKQKIINEKLKLDKHLKEIENKGFNEILQRQQEEQIRLIQQYNSVFDTFINISSIANREDEESSDDNIIKENTELYLTKESVTNRVNSSSPSEHKINQDLTNSDVIEYNDAFFEKIINELHLKIGNLQKISHEKLYINTLLQRDLGNLKILIEKCIEDLKYDYKKVNSEIFRKTRGSFGVNPLSNVGIVGSNNIKLKNRMNLIETKIYKISYIYDNCFGSLKKLKKSQSTISIPSINKSRKMSL